MSADVPDGALSVEAVLEWLPDRRLSVDYLPALLDQNVERIRIDVGTLTTDDDGQWITTLYVSDVEHECMHAVGWDLEADEWVAVGTWLDDGYDADAAEERVVEWTEETYPESAFTGT